VNTRTAHLVLNVKHGKRVFDVLGASIAIILLLPVILLVAIFVKTTSSGEAFYWSDRIGKENKIFRMPKFRTMRVGTPDVATHLLDNPSQYLTPIGAFLRKSSLDELPQFWSVIRGEMSLVGPRPALHNQSDLIFLRTQKSIHTLKPGISGWAQVNGRDDIEVEEKVVLDEEYLSNQSLALDIKILLMTVFKVAKRERVSH